MGLNHWSLVHLSNILLRRGGKLIQSTNAPQHENSWTSEPCSAFNTHQPPFRAECACSSQRIPLVCRYIHVSHIFQHSLDLCIGYICKRGFHGSPKKRHFFQQLVYIYTRHNYKVGACLFSCPYERDVNWFTRYIT